MEGERGVVVEKWRQCQSKEAFSGERKLTGDSVVIIEKGEKCRSLKTFSGGRKSAGAEVPVVPRYVSVNVTDAVTQSITGDVKPLLTDTVSLFPQPPGEHHCLPLHMDLVRLKTKFLAEIRILLRETGLGKIQRLG
jgi:hypothetical protein